jgi:hypothetical protein
MEAISTISRKDFIHDLKTAIQGNSGYAAGKIGNSEQHWLFYEIFLNSYQENILSELNEDELTKQLQKNSLQFELCENELIKHFLKNTGLFPVTHNFVLQYGRFYIEHVKSLDCVGLWVRQELEPEIINYYQLKNKFIRFTDLEFDMSIPNNESNCYLQYFRDRKILLICPFAELLKIRATKEIFEGVWSNTGKKWFSPQYVDYLEFPYGFSNDTHKKYSNAIDLFEYIKSEINKKDFDIALIAAAGLAIPIASYIKNIGKIAISLGGILQILFGVIGGRWRNHEFWQNNYFNSWWIDMPDKYRPKETDVCDIGAYW